MPSPPNRPPCGGSSTSWRTELAEARRELHTAYADAIRHETTAAAATDHANQLQRQLDQICAGRRPRP